VGEANPYGDDPYFALYPAPDGCSGYRLCCLILRMRISDYLREFERVNLCWRDWDAKEARQRALELSIIPRPKILLGAKVAKSFGFTPFRPFELVDDKVVVLPHPSGLSRSWNDPGAYQRARGFVQLIVEPRVIRMIGMTDLESDE
jgi:hypothetical protein